MTRKTTNVQQAAARVAAKESILKNEKNDRVFEVAEYLPGSVEPLSLWLRGSDEKQQSVLNEQGVTSKRRKHKGQPASSPEIAE